MGATGPTFIWKVSLVLSRKSKVKREGKRSQKECMFSRSACSSWVEEAGLPPLGGRAVRPDVCSPRAPGGLRGRGVGGWG